MEELENMAMEMRCQTRRNGYGIVKGSYGSIRVKKTRRFQYFLNNIEVNREYAEWFLEHA